MATSATPLPGHRHPRPATNHPSPPPAQCSRPRHHHPRLTIARETRTCPRPIVGHAALIVPMSPHDCTIVVACSHVTQPMPNRWPSPLSLLLPRSHVDTEPQLTSVMPQRTPCCCSPRHPHHHNTVMVGGQLPSRTPHSGRICTTAPMPRHYYSANSRRRWPPALPPSSAYLKPALHSHSPLPALPSLCYPPPSPRSTRARSSTLGCQTRRHCPHYAAT